MISLSFSVAEDQIQLAYDALQHIPKAAPKAIARALNRALEGARTDAVKIICDTYQIPAAAVRKTFLIKRAYPEKLEALIISTGGVIPLIKFKVSPKKPPLQTGKRIDQRTRVIAGVKFGVSETMPHAFVAKMKSGHVGVFSRESVPSFPIKQLYGPSIPQMLGAAQVLKYIEEQAQKRLEKELTHQISYLFGGGK